VRANIITTVWTKGRRRRPTKRVAVQIQTFNTYEQREFSFGGSDPNDYNRSRNGRRTVTYSNHSFILYSGTEGVVQMLPSAGETAVKLYIIVIINTHYSTIIAITNYRNMIAPMNVI